MATAGAQAAAVLDDLVEDLVREVCAPLHERLCAGALCLECGADDHGTAVHEPPPLGNEDFEARFAVAMGARLHKMADECVSTAPGLDVFGTKPRTVAVDNFKCSHCGKKVSAHRFAPHLEKCMLGGGRQSSRLADTTHNPMRDLPLPGPKRPRHGEGARTSPPTLVPSHIIDLSLFDTAAVGLD